MELHRRLCVLGAAALAICIALGHVTIQLPPGYYADGPGGPLGSLSTSGLMAILVRGLGY